MCITIMVIWDDQGRYQFDLTSSQSIQNGIKIPKPSPLKSFRLKIIEKIIIKWKRIGSDARFHFLAIMAVPFCFCFVYFPVIYVDDWNEYLDEKSTFMEEIADKSLWVDRERSRLSGSLNIFMTFQC